MNKTSSIGSINKTSLANSIDESVISNNSVNESDNSINTLDGLSHYALNELCSKCFTEDSVTTLADSGYTLCKKCASLYPKCTTCGRIYDNTKYGRCVECHIGNDICKITDKLFISDYEASKKYKKLKKLGIKQILTVACELPVHEHPDFTTMKISIDDNPIENIKTHFDIAHKFIDNDVTLVHCYAGISRSATIVISYMMRQNKMLYQEAFDLCFRSRPIINPNYGFVIQLIDFEQDLLYLEDDNDKANETGINHSNNYRCLNHDYRDDKCSEHSATADEANSADDYKINDLDNDAQLTDSTFNSTDRPHSSYLENDDADHSIINMCDNIFDVAMYRRHITMYPAGVALFNKLYEDIKLPPS
jgi:predicted protein tyrosine phosphatase